MRLSNSLAEASDHTVGRQEAVYLLHGFAGNRLLMHRLAKFLARRNYFVRNWKYPSVRQTIAENAMALRSEIYRAVEEGHFASIHFVTHSLGSIIVRQAFSEERPPNLGRIVMLAPPNGGSHLARVGAVVIGRLCPVLHELSTRDNSYVKRLGVSDQLEVGIIAASNDWVVRRRNTHLPTQRDHVVVRGDHLRLPFLRAAAEQAIHFLERGTFRRDQSSKRNVAAAAIRGVKSLTRPQ